MRDNVLPKNAFFALFIVVYGYFSSGQYLEKWFYLHSCLKLEVLLHDFRWNTVYSCFFKVSNALMGRFFFKYSDCLQSFSAFFTC
jgi:hypothetical protein